MRALQAFVVQGALLLFMLQPLVGRMLLPVHGGSFQVWTTCMLFFQLALLAGYAYAHLLLPRIGRWHVAVVAASLLCAPLTLDWFEARAGSLPDILLSLTVGVALPFVVLATTSIVAQLHAATLDDPAARDPYSLYAWSNAGSLVGLLSYPLLLEPLLGLGAQRGLWAVGYVVYAVLAIRSMPTQWSQTTPPRHRERIPPARMMYWTLISAGACSVLLGMTNVLSLGAGSIPLVWVLTLAAYLLGFVAAFARDSGRLGALRAFAPEAALLGMFAYHEASWLRAMLSERGLLGLQVLSLFWITWNANAELHRTRPAVSGLTTFYLCIALGGALGGILVSVLAPLLLTDLYEYPIALLLLAITLAWGQRTRARTWLLERTNWAQGARLQYGRLLRALALGGLSAWSAVPFFTDARPSHAMRNFYGLYAVWEHDRSGVSEVNGHHITRAIRVLSHNGTNHGFASLRSGERCTPTGYFHRGSGVGELLGLLPGPRRAAVIGLGAGTLAAYFSARDALTFYEIDPATLRLARAHFDFLERCGARPRVVIGDARIELGRDRELADHSLDVLIVDAFSGDSIPFHLLTREALQLYLSKVRPGGKLVFHVSSRFFELWPAISSTAHSLGLHSALRTRREHDIGDPLAWSSQYLVASTDKAFIDRLAARGWIASTDVEAEVWTDDRVSLLPSLWRRLR